MSCNCMTYFSCAPRSKNAEAFLNRKGNEHNMEKQVLVHVSGLHMMEGDGQEEPVEIVVPGEHYFRNGSHYVRYEGPPNYGRSACGDPSGRNARS